MFTNRLKICYNAHNMKVAIFTDCYLDLTGGIRSSINAQKTALEQNGHAVYIFSTGFPRPLSELKELAAQNIFKVPSCRLFFRGLTPVSRRPKIIERWLLRNFPELKDFDVFYIHYESGCSIAGLRLGKQLGIPTVQVMHGREDVGESNIAPPGLRSIIAFFLNLFHSWYLPHPKTILRDNHLANSYAKAKMWTLMVNHANFADLVLTPSDHFRQKLISYGVEKPIEVLPNGFPDERFLDQVPVRELQPGAPLRIIWHSRVSAEKRIMPFLEALRRVHGNYRLDVYGGGGDYYRAKRFASRHNLKVVFHGNTDFRTIAVKLPRSHLDVLVSYDFDTFGMTLIEAEAFGTPVFFCDPDMQEVVPKDSFVMSENETPEAMASALDDLINHPEKIRAMSEVMLKHRSEVLISERIKILEKLFNAIIKR